LGVGLQQQIDKIDKKSIIKIISNEFRAIITALFYPINLKNNQQINRLSK